MPTDGSDSSQGGAGTAVADPERDTSPDSDTDTSAGAEALEKKLEMIGKAALVTVTMAVKASLARGGEGLSDAQRGELAEVREKLVTSLEALDAQSRVGGLAGVDLGGLRDKIVRSIEELDEHLLPDHPGQHSGAHETPPS